MTRNIIQKPLNGGKQCEGPLTKTVNCKLPPCPVDCQWTPWNYGSCSEPCGTGRRNRTRTISETQKFGGTCTGKSRELEYCNTNPCPGKIFIYNVEFLMIIKVSDSY